MQFAAPLLRAIRETFATPTADPLTSVFVIAMLLAVLIVAVLGLLLLLTPRRTQVVKIRRYRTPASDRVGDSITPDELADDGVAAELSTEGDSEGGKPQPDPSAISAAESPVTKRRTPVWDVASLVLIVLLVVGAFVAAYVVTGTDSYCAGRCHGSGEHARSATMVDHAGCVSCHEVPGFSGLTSNVVSRARMAYRGVLTPVPKTTGEQVADAGCLTCHDGILQSTTRSGAGVMMSHREPVDAGMPCVECHDGVGHTTARSYSMAQCVTCHGDSEELGACETCHVSDPYGRPSAESDLSSVTVGEEDIVYPMVKVDRPDCGGCHRLEASCDPCHGLRLPHPAAFVNGGHARDAAFERKAKCTRCHTMNSCQMKCHTDFDGGHGPTWKVQHAKMKPTATCACHAMRSGRSGPMCVLCH